MPRAQVITDLTTIASTLRNSRRGDEMLKIIKIVDITAFCANAGGSVRVYLIYMQDARGMVVQVCGPCTDTTLAVRNHFFVKEIGEELKKRPIDNYFMRAARRAGIDGFLLSILMREHVPEEVTA